MKDIKKSNRIEKIANAKSQQLEKEVAVKKRDEEKIELMTQFMLDPTSSATKLLEKRREMYELQEALQQDKQKFQDREENFKKTEEEIRNRDEEFHKKIVEYYRSTFERKQTDAQNHAIKIEHEKKIKVELEDSISKLTKKNSKLRGDLGKLKKIYDSLKKYEDFLKMVRENHPENFNDINGVIEKHKVLEEKYREIKEETDKARKKKEEERQIFKQKKSQHEIRINNLISSIQAIQNDLKSQKESKKELENQVTAMEANSNSVVSSLEMILLSVNNIYEKCSRKKEWTQHGDPKEFEKVDKNEEEKKKLHHRVEEAKRKIKYINNYINDYQWIIENNK